MKKILLVTTAIFLLAGCTQTNNNVPVDEPVSDETVMGTYNNAEFNISFNYPSDWSIEENDTNKSVTVQSTRPDNGSEMIVTVPAESFDEYEDEMSELIASDKMSVENNSPLEDTNYPSKEYGQHGWLYYLIEINGNYVGVGNEMYLTQDQKEGLKEILNSLSFSDSFTVNGDKVTVNSENLTFSFTDNFKIAGQIIEFGPKTKIPEPPTNKEYTRPAFVLNLVPQRSYNEIQNSESATSEFNLTTVNSMEVVNWEDSTFCETNYFEIIGETQNIQLTNRNCGTEITPKDYLNSLLESVE